MEIKQNLVSSSKYDIKCPYAMTPKYITIHGTGNDSPAKNEISYMINNNNEVSFHVAVDDVEAIQGVPFSKNCWHCGDGGSGTGNRQSIGIEICYDLSGGSRFDKAEDNATIITAQLMKQFNIPISNVVQHNNWSGKNCPKSIRAKANGWNNFIAKVQNALNGETTPSQPQPSQPTPQPPSTNSGKYLFLKGHMTKWNVYPTNVAPVTGNQCGSLNPSLFGGVEYEILGNPQKDVYTIQTRDYGKVNIYVPKDNDSEFYTKGENTVVEQPKPQPSNKKYVNLSSNDAYWRVYRIGGAYTVGNEIGKLMPATYGGLSYVVEKELGNMMYQITTSSYGTVAVWCDDITTSPRY